MATIRDTMENKHTAKVKGVNFEKDELAERIGNLYYDSLAELLQALSAKLQKDSEADRKRGRVKLAGELAASAKQVAAAARHIENAWDICEPFVKKWRAEKKDISR
ncbi:MAG: hypothetical protein JZU65_13975 [Chlorobium sp.]|nr:hypothetical protein [Chlorobium sp.]